MKFYWSWRCPILNIYYLYLPITWDNWGQRSPCQVYWKCVQNLPLFENRGPNQNNSFFDFTLSYAQWFYAVIWTTTFQLWLELRAFHCSKSSPNNIMWYAIRRVKVLDTFWNCLYTWWIGCFRDRLLFQKAIEQRKIRKQIIRNIATLL